MADGSRQTLDRAPGDAQVAAHAIARCLGRRAEQAFLVARRVVAVRRLYVGVGGIGRDVDELHRQPQAADAVGDRVVHLGEQRRPTIRQALDDVEEPQRSRPIERVLVERGGQVEQLAVVAR